MLNGKKSEEFLRRGQFQRAVRSYELEGNKENALVAALACAQDCLEFGMYEMAIEYFKYAGRTDLADELAKTADHPEIHRGKLESLDLITTNPCGRERRHKYPDLHETGFGMEKFVEKVQSEDFIVKAEKLKIREADNS